jgi:hypothetical protein
MSTTNPYHIEGTEVSAAAKPKWRSRLRRRPALLGAVAGIAGLALLIAGWSAVAANAQNDTPAPAVGESSVAEPQTPQTVETPVPADDGENTSYEQCVTAALASFGPSEEASNPGSNNVGTAPQAPGRSGAGPEAPDVEEPHPNSPAHEWCTADCPEDEQCARPREFTVVSEEDFEMVSFENPDLTGDPAS